MFRICFRQIILYHHFCTWKYFLYLSPVLSLVLYSSCTCTLESACISCVSAMFHDPLFFCSCCWSTLVQTVPSLMVWVIPLYTCVWITVMKMWVSLYIQYTNTYTCCCFQIGLRYMILNHLQRLLKFILWYTCKYCTSTMCIQHWKNHITFISVDFVIEFDVYWFVYVLTYLKVQFAAQLLQ